MKLIIVATIAVYLISVVCCSQVDKMNDYIEDQLPILRQKLSQASQDGDTLESLFYRGVIAAIHNYKYILDVYGPDPETARLAIMALAAANTPVEEDIIHKKVLAMMGSVYQLASTKHLYEKAGEDSDNSELSESLEKIAARLPEITPEQLSAMLMGAGAVDADVLIRKISSGLLVSNIIQYIIQDVSTDNPASMEALRAAVHFYTDNILDEDDKQAIRNVHSQKSIIESLELMADLKTNPSAFNELTGQQLANIEREMVHFDKEVQKQQELGKKIGQNSANSKLGMLLI